MALLMPGLTVALSATADAADPRGAWLLTSGSLQPVGRGPAQQPMAVQQP